MIHLVRHGETPWSSKGVYSGRRELALTERGREQAAQAGERLRAAGVDAVHTSPLGRARATAAAIAAASGAALRVEQRLTEIDYGPLEGLDRAAASARHGAAYERWRARPFEDHLQGMEPLSEALARVAAAIAAALADARSPVLVGHQGSLRLALIALGRIAPGDYFSTRIAEAEPLAIEVVARTLPSGRREPGLWRGKVTIHDDFDQLPEEIARAFRGLAP